MWLVQIQSFGIGTKCGLEILHQYMKQDKTKCQKVLGTNSYVFKNYREKTGNRAFLPPLLNGLPEKLGSGSLDSGPLDDRTLDVWTLDAWTLDARTLETGRLNSGSLDAHTLDNWNLDNWMLGLWTPRLWKLGLWTIRPNKIKFYPFLVTSFLLQFRHIVQIEFSSNWNALQLVCYGSVERAVNGCFNSNLLQLIL